MMPDDTRPDPELARHLVLLPRHEPTSAAFTDRVVVDLARRGLVRGSVVASDARWLAAAAVIFALGVGAGAAVAPRPTATGMSRPIPPVPRAGPAAEALRTAADVNVPPLGKSEVWF